MTDSSVRPALTREEWENGEVRGRGCDSDVLFHGGAGKDLSLLEDGGLAAIIGDGGSLHALAALALAGQPFGFTGNDLHWVEVAANANRVEANECRKREMSAEVGGDQRLADRCLQEAAALEAHAANLENLAARIAALLPPRP